jgi:predicted transcriptional regulator
MNESKKLEPISIRLDPDVKAALQELARADDRTLSAFINRILRNYVESVRGKKPRAKG